MRAVLQRVERAAVTIGDEAVGRIGVGWFVYLGVGPGDGPEAAAWLADRVAGLRGFADYAGKMNLAVTDIGGAVLVVSNFTLYADVTSGRRPSFTGAARPEVAEPLVAAFVRELQDRGIRVEQGRFGADMRVSLVNDGPVTFVMDSGARS